MSGNEGQSTYDQPRVMSQLMAFPQDALAGAMWLPHEPSGGPTRLAEPESLGGWGGSLSNSSVFQST